MSKRVSVYCVTMRVCVRWVFNANVMALAIQTKAIFWLPRNNEIE